MIHAEPRQEAIKQLPSVETKIHSFRQEVIEKIQKGQELTLPMQLRNGGDFLVRAAFWEVLARLCVEEGLDLNQVKVTAQVSEDEEFTDYHEKAMAIFSIGIASGRLDRSAARSGTLFQQSLAQFAFSLGVLISPEDFQMTPRIWPVDKGPLRNYDEIKVAERAAKLREEIGDRRVVVIGQAGSSAEKRLADVQVVSLSLLIDDLQPDAYIVVLSDKPFLRNDMAKVPEHVPAGTHIGFPFRENLTPTEHYSPEAVEKFHQELSSTLPANDRNGIDRVVETTDINELLAYLRIAEEGVFTDSYWMHLAASQDIPTLISLYTLFRPEEWAPPGSISVVANALTGERADHISAAYYHQNKAYEKGSKSHVGIEYEDIQMLKDTVSLRLTK